MTVLFVPPPPLPPVREDTPEDIDFDFHIDFSLAPLPTFQPPPPLDYPESEHEIDSLRLSPPSIYSQCSGRASLPSLQSLQDDTQSCTFWGSFGVSSPTLDDDPSDMTAPLRVVKRDLPDRRSGDRSAMYATEFTVPDLTIAMDGIAENEDGEVSPHSQRTVARSSLAPSHCVSVPHSPTTSACDHDFKSIPMPNYYREGRKISLHFPDRPELNPPARDEAQEPEDVHAHAPALMKYPPFPVDVDANSEDELLSGAEWGAEQTPEMRRDSGHSSDGALVPATPQLVASRLPSTRPTRPPRPPPNLCPPVNGRPLPYLPEEQYGQHGYLSSSSATRSQAGASGSLSPPPADRVDVRRHSVYSPRDSGSDFSSSRYTKVTSPDITLDDGDSESLSKWRPGRDPAGWQRQRELALPPSPSAAQFPRKLNPRSPLTKDGQEDVPQGSFLFSDTEEDDDVSAAPSFRARSAASSSRRRSSMPESPSAFDIPAKAASILGLGDSAPESSKRGRRGLLGDIGGKRLLRRRGGNSLSGSGAVLRGHMRKLSEFDPIGFVKGEPREAHIDRNGDLWVNVSAEAKKRPESTRGRPDSAASKGLPTLPQSPAEVGAAGVAEHVELYHALKGRALPPTPGSPPPRPPKPKRSRPASGLFSPLRSTSSGGTVLVPPPIQESAPRPPSPDSPLLPPPRIGSPAPGSVKSMRSLRSAHQRSGSGASVDLTHVQPRRDTLIPYFPPDEQLVRYVPPARLGRPHSHAQLRARPVAPRTSHSLYESSARVAHPYGALSDATRDELVAALRTGSNLTPEQTALLEVSITALLSRQSVVETDLLAFPAPPPRASGELLRPENVLGEDEAEEQRSASVPPPRPPRRRDTRDTRDSGARRHSRGLQRAHAPAPLELLSCSETDESARDDRSDVDPAQPREEVSEWEPDTPSKARFPEFIKRLNAKKE